jgi:hypothetical protein
MSILVNNAKPVRVSVQSQYDLCFPTTDKRTGFCHSFGTGFRMVTAKSEFSSLWKTLILAPVLQNSIEIPSACSVPKLNRDFQLRLLNSLEIDQLAQLF